MKESPTAHEAATDDHDVAGDEAPLLSDNEYGQKDSSQESRKEAHGPIQRPSLVSGVSTLTRRPSFIDEEEQPVANATASAQPADKKEAPVTWKSLPKKGQLACLVSARLSEPLTERSMSAYMFYQLRWFDSSASDATIASQGGALTAAFAAAQFLTAFWWGRAADSPRIGRKRVLLVGLFGTCISALGIGFSKTFVQALLFRVMAGALNGNIGVLRVMTSEIVKEKKYQSRAFLLMPMCFNVGVVIGPIMGGFLADPVGSFPSVFGPGSPLGGKNGVGWMTDFPYALPNLVSGCVILISTLSVIFGLDETHELLRNKPDYGRKVGKFIARCILQRNRHDYTPLHQDQDPSSIDLGEHPQSTPATPAPQPGTHQSDPAVTSAPPLRSVFTPNVCLTLFVHHLLALHISMFNALIFLLLPAPRSSNGSSHLPFLFTGGLGLTTEQVGMATAIIGVIGLPLQLLLYPRLNQKLGTLRAYRMFLPFSVLAYAFLPYLSLLPNKAWLVWPGLTAIFTLQVLSRTFALPSTVILVNNSSPSPRALGTIHGFAQSVSSGARTMGPVIGGAVLGWGLKHNCVGLVWWGMAVIAGGNWGLSWTIWEGDGHGGRS